jgi:hypothetical protein
VRRVLCGVLFGVATFVCGFGFVRDSIRSWLDLFRNFEFESLIPVAPLLRSVSVAGLSRKTLERKQGTCRNHR